MPGVTKCLQQLKNTRSSVLFNPALTEIAIHAACLSAATYTKQRVYVHEWNGCYQTTHAGDVAGRVAKHIRWDMLQVVLPNISGGICCRSCYQTSQVGYVAGRITKHIRWNMLQVVLPKHLRRDMLQVVLPNTSGGIRCRSCYQTPLAGYVAGRVTKHLRWDMLQVVLPNTSDGICCRSCYQTSQVGYVAGRVAKKLRRDMLQVVLPNISGGICCRSCCQKT